MCPAVPQRAGTAVSDQFCGGDRGDAAGLFERLNDLPGGGERLGDDGAARELPKNWGFEASLVASKYSLRGSSVFEIYFRRSFLIVLVHYMIAVRAHG